MNRQYSSCNDIYVQLGDRRILFGTSLARFAHAEPDMFPVQSVMSNVKMSQRGSWFQVIWLRHLHARHKLFHFDLVHTHSLSVTIGSGHFKNTLILKTNQTQVSNCNLITSFQKTLRDNRRLVKTDVGFELQKPPSLTDAMFEFRKNYILNDSEHVLIACWLPLFCLLWTVARLRWPLPM